MDENPEKPAKKLKTPKASKASKKVNSRRVTLKDAKTGEDVPNVMTVGIKRGQVAFLNRLKGEFANFAIRSLADVRPLFNVEQMKDAAARLCRGEDRQEVARTLRLDDPSTVVAVVAFWFSDCIRQPLPSALAVEDDERKRLVKQCGHSRHMVPATLKTGKKGVVGTNCPMCRCEFSRSVAVNFPFVIESVPDWMDESEWVGREFASGWALHRAIDQLPCRQGHPQTTYTAIFSMVCKPRAKGWMSRAEFENFCTSTRFRARGTVSVAWDSTGAVRTDFSDGDSKREYKYQVLYLQSRELSTVGAKRSRKGETKTEKKRKTAKGSALIQKSDVGGGDGWVLKICGPLGHDQLPPDKFRSGPSFFASLMQKAIRRGYKCREALVFAVHGLMCSRLQYVPQLNFSACSGTRQLLWRLVITALEDVSMYEVDDCSDDGSTDGSDADSDADSKPPKMLRISELIGLALVAHSDPHFRLPPRLLRRVEHTALTLQHCHREWNWRAIKAGVTSGGTARLPTTDQGRECCAAIDVVAQVMPCMRADLDLLRLAPRNWEPVMDIDDELDDDVDLKQNIGKDGCRKQVSMRKWTGEARACVLAACDHHCFPWTILVTQAILPMPPRGKTHETPTIARRIWDWSSAQNFRRPASIQTPDARSPGEVALGKAIVGAQRVAWTKKAADLGLRPCRGMGLDPGIADDAEWAIGSPVVDCGDAKNGEWGTGVVDEYTSRGAFVSLIGRRTHLSIGKRLFTAIAAGPDAARPLLVHKGTSSSAADGDNPYRYLTEAVTDVEDAYVKHFASPGRMVDVPGPPPGLLWRWDSEDAKRRKRVNVVVTRSVGGALVWSVDGASPIAAFDGRSLVKAAARVETSVAWEKNPRVMALLKAACYCEQDGACDPAVIMRLKRVAKIVRAQRLGLVVPQLEWLRTESRVRPSVWRDVLTKIRTREAGHVDVYPVGRSGRRQQQAVRYQTEGTMIRMLGALCVLYPDVLRHTTRLRFKVSPHNTLYMHMIKQLEMLAFPPAKTPAKRTLDSMLSVHWISLNSLLAGEQVYMLERYGSKLRKERRVKCRLLINPWVVASLRKMRAQMRNVRETGDMPVFKKRPELSGYNGAGIMPMRWRNGKPFILLGLERRKKSVDQLMLTFVGGKREADVDRTPIETAAREFDEEIAQAWGPGTREEWVCRARGETEESTGVTGVWLERGQYMLFIDRWPEGPDEVDLHLFRKTQKSPARRLPTIRTRVWKHQQDTAMRIVDGVARGQRGFADASTVGAGKTLAAIRSMERLSRAFRTFCGALVLVPQIKLIEVWTDEFRNHSSGFRVLVQNSRGDLRAWNAQDVAMSAQEVDAAMADPHVVVVTTLGRSRDHPFARRWSLVVVDECTSVQNDTALQTAEAWRQSVSSDYGVLMLSATFFRARFSKLFYMIRMLQSPVPRTADYLNALLADHIICHVPDTRRDWHIEYERIPLPPKLRAKYDQLLQQRGRTDGKRLYASLKKVLGGKPPIAPHDGLGSSDVEMTGGSGGSGGLVPQLSHKLHHILVAMRKRTEWLASEKGRRPLVFCNTQREKEQLLRGWSTRPASSRVLTRVEGAFGLNMQHECDALVCRPQPGDVMEQMRGRIDRPGQREKSLYLYILFTKDTVEEAEAANIRLCGRFVRQYLNPLGREFRVAALSGGVDAIRAGMDQVALKKPVKTKKKTTKTKKKTTKTKKKTTKTKKKTTKKM